MYKLKNYCRICLSSPNDITTIYASHKGRYLPQVIHNISGVKLLPKKEPNAKICASCSNAVIAAESIILRCQESEEYLSQQNQQREKTKMQLKQKYTAERELVNNKITEKSNEPDLMSSQSTQENGAFFASKAEITSSQSTQENEAIFAIKTVMEHDTTFEAEDDLEENSQSTLENDAAVSFETVAKTKEATKSNKIADFDYALEEDELCQFETFQTSQEISSRKTKKLRNASITPNNHECQHCSYRTNSRKCLVDHYSDVHKLDESSMYKCSICEETFSWRRTLFLHMEKIHKIFPQEKRFICNECGKAYFRKHFLDDHMKWHRGIVKYFKCPKLSCGKTFNRKFTLQRHFLSMHTDVKRYFCEECDLHFTCLDKWRYHVQSIHERKHCPTCRLWFRKQKVLDAHIASKKCEKCIYQCPKCPRRFTTERGVKLHLEQSCKHNKLEENRDIKE